MSIESPTSGAGNPQPAKAGLKSCSQRGVLASTFAYVIHKHGFGCQREGMARETGPFRMPPDANARPSAPSGTIRAEGASPRPGVFFAIKR